MIRISLAPSDLLNKLLTLPQLAGKLPERWRARFASKVAIGGECWEWTAGTSNGYGRFAVTPSRIEYSHRLSFIAVFGQPHRSLTIDHLCRNRRCVRPWHLQAVSNRENILRGAGFSGRNAQKTECAHGHALTTENTRNVNGWRQCVTCERSRDRARYRALTAEDRARRNARNSARVSPRQRALAAARQRVYKARKKTRAAGEANRPCE